MGEFFVALRYRQAISMPLCCASPKAPTAEDCESACKPELLSFSRDTLNIQGKELFKCGPSTSHRRPLKLAAQQFRENKTQDYEKLRAHVP